MRVQVLLFASARDLAGKSRVDLSLPEGALAGDAWETPELGPLRLPGTRLALNHRFSEGTEPLKDGDVLAVLPPVSGG